jgi:hypothetical protein
LGRREAGVDRRDLVRNGALRDALRGGLGLDGGRLLDRPRFLGCNFDGGRLLEGWLFLGRNFYG